MTGHEGHPVPAARQHRSYTVLTGIVVMILAAAWAAHHALVAARWDARTTGRLAYVWGALFLVFLVQTVLYHLERPRRVRGRAARMLDALNVAILVPAYNEDEGLLRLMLESFLHQSRRPDSVHVVDDGSTTSDYAGVRAWWLEEAGRRGIATTWERVPNAGKRHAQARGVAASPDADIYITVDSDSCLAPNALHEILCPFARPRVQSVAGIVVATNNRGPARPHPLPRDRDTPGGQRHTVRARCTHVRRLVAWRSSQLLARVTDLWFVTNQLVDRSGQSALGAVLVNSGPLAAYRAAIVRDNLGSYLSETFMGRPVMFSDDSLLTLYAQERGLTVQQPTAIVFSAMPERWSHFVKMYTRWMRGSSIRAIWRLRYLSPARPAFWFQVTRLFQLITTLVVTVWLLLIEPVAHDNLPPLSALYVPFLLGWALALRYLGIVRSDERIRSRLLTWTLMPLAIVMSWTLLRWLRWYGLATCARTGWGTRQNGAEVSLDASRPAAELRTHAAPAPHLEQPTLALPQIPASPGA